MVKIKVCTIPIALCPQNRCDDVTEEVSSDCRKCMGDIKR